MNTLNRIQDVLSRIGLNHLPDDFHAPLAQGGLDSLMLALLILELEVEFKIKIPVVPFIKEHYESMASIERHINELETV